MITLRRSDDRGHFDHGWLNTFHTFSFGDYFDPAHKAFRSLRVINEDFVAGGMGFEPHDHKDMEIITYILDGALQHKDSMGNSTVIRPGEVQRMSAGTGVTHSEFNPNPDHPTHLLQIWIFPDRRGHAPSYGQQSFEKALSERDLVLVASQNGRDGSVSLNQDADLYIAKTKTKPFTHDHPIRPGRGIWVQVVRGKIKVGSVVARAGDGVAVDGETSIQLQSEASAEYLLFDLP